MLDIIAKMGFENETERILRSRTKKEKQKRNKIESRMDYQQLAW